MVQVRRGGSTGTGVDLGILSLQTPPQRPVLALTFAADALKAVAPEAVRCEVLQGCGKASVAPATPSQVGEGFAE